MIFASVASVIQLLITNCGKFMKWIQQFQQHSFQFSLLIHSPQFAWAALSWILSSLLISLFKFSSIQTDFNPAFKNLSRNWFSFLYLCNLSFTWMLNCGCLEICWIEIKKWNSFRQWIEFIESISNSNFINRNSFIHY